MSDKSSTTATAPERIWLSGNNDGDPNYYTDGEQPEIAIEYVRADLATLRAPSIDRALYR